MNSPVYKTAIIGFGNIGYSLSNDKKRKLIWSHFEAYNKIKKTKLIAIVEIDKKKRNIIKKKYPKLLLFKNIDELLISNTKIDIFSICTPTKTHFTILTKLISQNPKLIICEKPICSNIKEGRLILKKLKKSKNQNLILVNHQRRYEKNFILSKELLKKKIIGKIRSVNGYYSKKIYNIGTHLFDCIRMLIDSEPKLISSFFLDKNNIDPTLIGIIKFDNGIDCTINATGKKYNYIFELDIIGTKGRLKILENGKKIKLYKYLKSKNFTNYYELKKIDFKNILKKKFFLSNDPMKNLFENGIRSFEKKIKLYPSAFDGYQNLLIADTMVKSAKLRKIIKV